MTTNIQQGTLLDVLKKKMRQTKEEMEKYKDECEEFQKRLQGEIIRREEVSSNITFYTLFFFRSFYSYSLPPSPFTDVCRPVGEFLCEPSMTNNIRVRHKRKKTFIYGRPANSIDLFHLATKVTRSMTKTEPEKGKNMILWQMLATSTSHRDQIKFTIRTREKNKIYE